MKPAVSATSVLRRLISGATTLDARDRAGFVLANGAKRGHPCSMKIIAGIRQHAAGRGLSEDEALKKGLDAESLEFLERGMEVFAQA